MRHYVYVGPLEIRKAACSQTSGTLIESLQDLRSWLAGQQDEFSKDGIVTATFVIDLKGRLRLAPRRSEHVACAAGERVLSAGEITFSGATEVVEVTNQSTGYCPEPESWPAVEQALERLGLRHPGEFTTTLIFRLCPKCGERNIVKDDWFICDLCGADLPMSWNFNPAEERE